MRRGRAIGYLAGAIIALSAISLLVLSDVPANSTDSAEKAMIYLSLVLFVMALALVGPLAIAVINKGEPKADRHDESEAAEDEDDEASEIELEFRALEMEIEREEKG